MKNKHFTLVELMIVVAILGVFLKGVWKLPVKAVIFSQQQHHSHTQNMSLIMFIEKLKNDISNAKQRISIDDNSIKIGDTDTIIYRFENNTVQRNHNNKSRSFEINCSLNNILLQNNNVLLSLHSSGKNAQFVFPIYGGYYAQKQ